MRRTRCGALADCFLLTAGVFCLGGGSSQVERSWRACSFEPGALPSNVFFRWGVRQRSRATACLVGITHRCRCKLQSATR